MPTCRETVAKAMDSLKVSQLLKGYRGGCPGDIDAAIDAVLSVADFALDYWHELIDWILIPLIVRPHGKGGRDG